jgi:hypothetical protein
MFGKLACHSVVTVFGRSIQTDQWYLVISRLVKILASTAESARKLTIKIIAAAFRIPVYVHMKLPIVLQTQYIIKHLFIDDALWENPFFSSFFIQSKVFFQLRINSQKKLSTSLSHFFRTDPTYGRETLIVI